MSNEAKNEKAVNYSNTVFAAILLCKMITVRNFSTEIYLSKIVGFICNMIFAVYVFNSFYMSMYS